MLIMASEHEPLVEVDAMEWTEPKHTREQVNKAMRDYLAFNFDEVISDTPDWTKWHAFQASLAIINNWRSSHSYPLNTFQVTLRSYARKISRSPLIAQRMKRLSSIETKLMRYPKMSLTQMQDIAGCRAVVRTIGEVDRLVLAYRRSGIKHELASTDDYINNPKLSGYRGVHLVYRYKSDKQRTVYNGLKIEIQVRSQNQHAWATAVETVGTFVQQALKSSSGEPEWLRFFSLMGTAIANFERSPCVPQTPTDRAELITELKHFAHELKVAPRLRAYGQAMKTLITDVPNKQKSHFYLLVLEPAVNQVTVSAFRADQFEEASARYADAEKVVKTRPGVDAVLVSVDSLSALERAYPNYFADTTVFLNLLERALTEKPATARRGAYVR